MMRCVMQMRGPYRSTIESAERFPLLPFFRSAPEKSAAGIYFQAVQIGTAYRIRYVGETGKNGETFEGRLCSENASWLSARDTPKRQFDNQGQLLELDPASFRNGVEAYLNPAKDMAEQRSIRTESLNDTLLFFGALSNEWIEQRKLIEAAIIRHIKSCTRSEVAAFLYNKQLRTRAFSGILEIRPPDGIIFEGLAGTIVDSA